MKRSVRIACFALGVAILSGCSYLVDEDQSDCGGAIRIDYRLRLVTNEQTELEKMLSEQKDAPVKKALQASLEGIFTDIAHDVDLSFYDQTGLRLEHLETVVDQERFDCSLYLPAQTILHACTANVADNGAVTLEGGETGPAGQFVQHAAEGVTDPHRTGLFTGRKTLDVRPDADQQFAVDLTIVNAATALVVLPAAAATGIVTGTVEAFRDVVTGSTTVVASPAPVIVAPPAVPPAPVIVAPSVVAPAPAAVPSTTIITRYGDGSVTTVTRQASAYELGPNVLVPVDPAHRVGSSPHVNPYVFRYR